MLLAFYLRESDFRTELIFEDFAALIQPKKRCSPLGLEDHMLIADGFSCYTLFILCDCREFLLNATTLCSECADASGPRS